MTQAERERANTQDNQAKELDHPCKATCSGWKAGYDKGETSAHRQLHQGYEWSIREMQKLEDQIKALKAIIAKIGEL